MNLILEKLSIYPVNNSLNILVLYFLSILRCNGFMRAPFWMSAALKMKQLIASSSSFSLLVISSIKMGLFVKKVG